MNLENYWYVFNRAVPARLCSDIINYAKKHQERIGVIGEHDGATLTEKNLKELNKTRKSNVVFLEDYWIYKEIIPYVREANFRAGWNFQFDYSEAMQFTKYENEGHYDWHQDAFIRPYNKPNEPHINGRIRKLSVTLALCEGDEYEGGNLELDPRNGTKGLVSRPMTEERSRNKGTLTIFPSFVWHRVTPVTKGTRYSLVIWNCGFPYV